MADLNCEKLITKIDGQKENLTVGQHVVFQCSGTWDKIFNFKNANVVLNEENKYTVKVLKAEARSVSSFDVDVAFYSAGEFSFTDFILSDGANQIHLGEQKIKVDSVIEQPKDGKQPQSFGPVLPISLSWPAYYLTGLIGIILIAIGVIGWIMQRRWKYIRLIAKLKDYDGPTSADRQFYKAIRQAEIKGYPLKDVEHAFRFYITRAYQIPALDLRDRGLLSFFKRRNPWLKKERLELKKILEDFRSLEKLPEAQLEQEKKSFIQKLYRFVDHAEDVTKKKVTLG